MLAVAKVSGTPGLWLIAVANKDGRSDAVRTSGFYRTDSNYMPGELSSARNKKGDDLYVTAYI